jgi:hypothetical protein
MPSLGVSFVIALESSGFHPDFVGRAHNIALIAEYLG